MMLVWVKSYGSGYEEVVWDLRYILEVVVIRFYYVIGGKEKEIMNDVFFGLSYYVKWGIVYWGGGR